MIFWKKTERAVPYGGGFFCYKVLGDLEYNHRKDECITKICQYWQKLEVKFGRINKPHYLCITKICQYWQKLEV